jgi:hypothetical protein
MMVGIHFQMVTFFLSMLRWGGFFMHLGMAEVIDRILTEREELCCLAADGSTQTELLLMAF